MRMKKEHAEQFNRDIEQYRTALLYYARACDWENFKERAGRLFDYVEAVEYREVERRFYRIFNMILGFLVLTVIGIMTVDFSAYEGLINLKQKFLLSALAVGSYEVYIFRNYRKYAEVKSVQYDTRRRNFIQGIEQDFRGYASEYEQKAA